MRDTKNIPKICFNCKHLEIGQLAGAIFCNANRGGEIYCPSFEKKTKAPKPIELLHQKHYHNSWLDKVKAAVLEMLS